MTGICIIARLESKRLKRKHLINVNERCLIQWLTDRFFVEFKAEIEKGIIKLFITTSNSSQNKKFEQIFIKNNIDVFYGDSHNIPKRLLQCALENNLSKIIAIDGDDILCSTFYSRKVIELLNTKPYVSSKGLPLGMNVTGFTKDFLEKSNPEKYLKLETGWGKIFNNKKLFHLPIDFEIDADKFRMTLDYKEDEEFFKKTIISLGKDILKIKDKELLDHIERESINKINLFRSNEYWENFNNQKNLDG